MPRKSNWKTVKCKTCGFEYKSHPDVLDENKLDGNCIGCAMKLAAKEDRKRWIKKQ